MESEFRDDLGTYKEESDVNPEQLSEVPARQVDSSSVKNKDQGTNDDEHDSGQAR